MNTFVRLLIPVILLFAVTQLRAQTGYETKIAELRAEREQIAEAEKEALKEEVLQIENRLEAGEISEDEAQQLKEAAARKRALNIEDRLQMIDSEIALLERNEGEVRETTEGGKEIDRIEVNVNFDDEPWIVWEGGDRPVRYDRRTYSDLVFAFGLNNAIIEGQSLEDSPYKVAGSRFFEIGWAWRTRVFQHSNFLRLHYGFSFQFNGLKPDDNQYFVADNGETRLEEFEFDLEKSKFRMDNLVFPVHLEFGPSKRREYKNKIRYSLNNQLRVGVGGYAGINMGSRQKLKYNRNGDNVKDKLKRGYNTSDFIYGLSAYIGIESVLLYAKYDLNPIFEDAEVKQRNVSLGLRFDL